MSQHSVARCPCCGYRIGCATCPVCFWTDDGQRDGDGSTESDGPNGDISLSDAWLNFAIYGRAIHGT